MDAIEKIQLAQRTRLRNDSLWITLDWGGLMTPLAAQQVAMDTLAQAGVENSLAISDEIWGTKEYQRDRTHELNLAEVADQRQIAEDKVATGRAKLAIQRAMDEYTLAVRVYESKVKALLMGAREYAAQVELEQVTVEQSRAALAVAKEGLHQKQVNASIYYEYIQRAMVEADIAKAQVEVAKAHVRAVMADIAAGEADIKVITAQIEQYMAQADKAGLQADVATIFAEILTKKLSAVKLDVGREEIAAGFGYIQSRLDDVLKRMAIQKAEENLRIDYATSALLEEKTIFPDEKATEDLREQETLNAQEILGYQKTKTATNIDDETVLKQTMVVAQEGLADARHSMKIQTDDKSTWAKLMMNAAKQYVFLHSQHTNTERHSTTSESSHTETITEFIAPG